MGIVLVAVAPSAAIGGGSDDLGHLIASGGGDCGRQSRAGEVVLPVIAANPAICRIGALRANGTIPAGANRRPVAEEQYCRMAGASRGVVPEGCATGRQDSEYDHGTAAGRAAIGPVRRDVILDLFGRRSL